MISILKKWWKKWQSNPGAFDEGVEINKRRDNIAKMIASRYSKDDIPFTGKNWIMREKRTLLKKKRD